MLARSRNLCLIVYPDSMSPQVDFAAAFARPAHAPPLGLKSTLARGRREQPLGNADCPILLGLNLPKWWPMISPAEEPLTRADDERGFAGRTKPTGDIRRKRSAEAPLARPWSRSRTRRTTSSRPSACRSATIRSSRHRNYSALGRVR
jgi:hypothetical protein